MSARVQTQTTREPASSPAPTGDVIQRAAVSSGPAVAPPIVHDALRAPGQPLDSATRAWIEPRFGHDFSRVPTAAPQRAPSDLTIGPPGDRYEQEAERAANWVMRAAPAASAGYDFGQVRVHTGTLAAESARAVSARAYTVGRDIVFGAGEYAPQTSAGRRLLAHELAHTLQQTGAEGVPTARIQRAIGDGHDLASARFAGDETLEAVFDGEQILRSSERPRGEGVRKIQQALIDLEIPLPQFGADGVFGGETETAVREFQRREGLSEQEIDGRVGPQTMGLLDNKFASQPPNPAPPTPGGLSEQDVADPRIDPSAQASLIRLSRGEPDQQDAATGLLDAVKGGDLAGIIGEGLAKATISPQIDAFWAPLPAAFQGAVLARDPAQPQTAPAVVFREQLRLDTPALDAALQRARQIQTGAFPPPPCAAGPAAPTAAFVDTSEPSGGSGQSPIVCSGGGSGAAIPFLDSLVIIPERSPKSDIVTINDLMAPTPEAPQIDCAAKFLAVVNAEPQHVGKIFFRQYVLSLTRKDDSCGRGPMRVVKGPALDSRPIYNEPRTRSDGTGVITLAGGSAQNVTMTDGDAPSQVTDPPSCKFGVNARAALFASDEFRLLVMWQPDKGAPIALGHKDWGWRARGGFSKIGSGIGPSNWIHGTADASGPFITSTLARPGVEPATEAVIIGPTIMRGKEPCDPF